MAPVRERVDQLVHVPVFVDASGRRRAWVARGLGGASMMCGGYVLVLGIGLAGGSVAPDAALLPWAGRPHTPAVPPAVRTTTAPPSAVPPDRLDAGPKPTPGGPTSPTASARVTASAASAPVAPSVDMLPALGVVVRGGHLFGLTGTTGTTGAPPQAGATAPPLQPSGSPSPSVSPSQSPSVSSSPSSSPSPVPASSVSPSPAPSGSPFPDPTVSQTSSPSAPSPTGSPTSESSPARPA